MKGGGTYGEGIRVAILFEASPGFQPQVASTAIPWVSMFGVAILFEASPGFQLHPRSWRAVGGGGGVAILFEASPGFQLTRSAREGE